MIEKKERVGPGFGVGVVLLDKNNKVLLGQRFTNFGNGMWALPGGKIDKTDKTVFKAAEREVLEGTGIKIEVHKYISVGYESFYGLECVTFGVLTFSDAKALEIEPDKIGNWRRFSLGVLPEPLFGPSERIIQNFISGVMRSEDPII